MINTETASNVNKQDESEGEEDLSNSESDEVDVDNNQLSELSDEAGVVESNN